MPLNQGPSPVNIPEDEVKHLMSTFPYAWQSTALKYLGVHITPTFATLYQENSPQPPPPPYRQIRLMVQCWKKHYVSFLGRIASVNMTILPKLLYSNQFIAIYMEL